MTHDELRRLADLGRDQHDLITRRQLGAEGLTERQRLRRVDSGLLDRVGSHTYRSPFVTPSAVGDVAALVVDCGADAVVSGPTAAALHGFDGITLRPPFHVTVVRGRNVQRAHHRIHTTIELPTVDRSTVRGIPAMSATRTVIDLARFVRPVTLTAALDGALRDGLTSEEALHRRIVALRRSGRPGIRQLLAVIDGSEASRGGHSWLERRFLELCATAGLPRPVTQQVVAKARDRVVRVDCRFAGTPIIVELLGYRWHRTKEQMGRDAERLNSLLLGGLVPMQFTYEQVTIDPDWVVGQLRLALAQVA
jgi:hypothetical protein